MPKGKAYSKPVSDSELDKILEKNKNFFITKDPDKDLTRF